MDEYITTFHHSSCVKKSDISNHITNSIDNIYTLIGGHFDVRFKNGDTLDYDCFSNNHTLETEHFGLELLLSKDKAILSPFSYLDEDIMELDEDIVFDDYYQLSEEQITYIKMRF
ncbi:hypothetical protein RI056_00210 (plasmid) [Komagataeibacter nataicola]|nr:hypothetical protein [Komagataeibacter nataicola]WNM07299.1 hypothetical protein RI056_00210 [Komagataeibacter nataicola]